MEPEEQRTEDEERKDGSDANNNLAIGIAIGVALGAGLGVALDNIAVGMGAGIAIGVAIGIAMSQGNNGKEQSDDDPSQPDES